MSRFSDFLPARQFKERGLDREQEWQIHLDQIAQQEAANKLAKIGMIIDAVKTVGSLGTGIAGLSQNQQQIDLAKGAQEFEQGEAFDLEKTVEANSQQFRDRDFILETMKLPSDRYNALSRSMDFGNPVTWGPESMLPREMPRESLGIGDYAAVLGGGGLNPETIQLMKAMQQLNQMGTQLDFNQLNKYAFNPEFSDLETAIRRKGELSPELRAGLPTQQSPSLFRNIFNLANYNQPFGVMGAMSKIKDERSQFEEQKKLWIEWLRANGYLPE